MTVNVGLAAGGALTPVIVPERATVQEALEAAQVPLTHGDQYLVGGKPVRPNHPLREADTLLVTQPIEGG